MDRTREKIEQEFHAFVSVEPKEKLLLEVLLDIRDELRQIRAAGNVVKWGPKLGGQLPDMR